MVSEAIVLDLLGRLRDYTEKLRPFRARSESEITADYTALWAVERGMQLAAQCVLDICNHIVSEVATERPANYRELILTAGRLGLCRRISLDDSAAWRDLATFSSTNMPKWTPRLSTETSAKDW